MTTPGAAPEPDGYRTELLPWWDGVHRDRTGTPARCAACDTGTDLLLIWKGEAAQVIDWPDLLPLCRRCARRVDTVLADRTSADGRWAGMPRYLAVESAVLRVTRDGRD